jgi:hypothetical protein
MHLLTIAGIAALSALAPAASGAQPQPDPDWPCIQRKVPELSVAQVWTGPPIEEARQNWRSDHAAARLAGELSARRMPIEEAEAAIASFAADLDPAEKAEKLTLLFAGLFVTLNNERGDVMAGIDRYGRKQKEMAEEIRAKQARLSQLRSATPDSPQVPALTDVVLAQVRIFNDRRTSLTYVCEVPTLIEQRLFALGRAIQNELPN